MQERIRQPMVPTGQSFGLGPPQGTEGPDYYGLGPYAGIVFAKRCHLFFLAYCCAFGCGIALIRHKNKAKVTKISGWLITLLFSLRFIVLILIILRGLNVVQF